MELRAVCVACVLTFGVSSQALGAAMQVQYDVEETPFKRQVLGTTPLTFKLYDNSNCSGSEIYATSIDGSDIDSVERLKLRKVPGATTRPPKTARLNVQLANVTTETSELFLTVTGTGISPVIRPCQAQPLTHPRPSIQSKVVPFSRTFAQGPGLQALTGVGFKPTTVLVWCGKGNGTLAGSIGAADQIGATHSLAISGGNPPTGYGDGVFTDPALVGVNPTGDTGSWVATLSSLDADGFTLDWSVNNGATFDVSCYALALR